MENYTFQGAKVKGERIMHSPSPFAKANLIYLQEIGSSQYIAPHSSSRGTQDSFLICLVEKGEGALSYQDVSYLLFAGDCFFIDCRRPYTLSSINNLWTIRWLHIQGANLSALHDKYVERCGALCFHCEDPSLIRQRQEILFRIAASTGHVKDMQLAEHITGLLAEMMKQCWKRGGERSDSSLRRTSSPVREYIEENFAKEEMSLETLAARFNYNKFYLARRFKEEYGMTVNQFITQKRVTEAKHLLRFSDLNIAEIAKASGFDDPNYFARVFKAVEGIPPKVFRKVWTAVDG